MSVRSFLSFVGPNTTGLGIGLGVETPVATSVEVNKATGSTITQSSAPALAYPRVEVVD